MLSRNNLQITLKALRDCTIHTEMFGCIQFKQGKTACIYGCTGFKITDTRDESAITLYFYNEMTGMSEHVTLSAKDFMITKCA